MQSQCEVQLPEPICPKKTPAENKLKMMIRPWS
jgi:hypothetical protein